MTLKSDNYRIENTIE